MKEYLVSILIQSQVSEFQMGNKYLLELFACQAIDMLNIYACQCIS